MISLEGKAIIKFNYKKGEKNIAGNRLLNYHRVVTGGWIKEGLYNPQEKDIPHHLDKYDLE